MFGSRKHKQPKPSDVTVYVNLMVESSVSTFFHWYAKHASKWMMDKLGSEEATRTKFGLLNGVLPNSWATTRGFIVSQELSLFGEKNGAPESFDDFMILLSEGLAQEIMRDDNLKFECEWADIAALVLCELPSTFDEFAWRVRFATHLVISTTNDVVSETHKAFASRVDHFKELLNEAFVEYDC